MHNFIQVFANVTFNKEANSAIKADGSLNDNNKFGRRDESGEVFAWYYTVNKKERFQKKPEELQTKIISKAEEKPWYSFQPERAPVQFDVDSKFKALLKSVWSNQLSEDPVKINTTFLAELTELAFKHGVIEKPADILPENKFASVPSQFKPMLHLVADNTNEEPKKAETPTARKSVAKSA
jgi:polyribonucleotide nucleotidyltransferase